MLIVLSLACLSPEPKESLTDSQGDSRTDSPTDSPEDSSPDSPADSGDTSSINHPPTADECGGDFPPLQPTGPTMAQGAGPYWRDDTPERNALNVWEEPGTRLVLALRVLNLDGSVAAGRRLTAWAAGSNGTYDEAGPDANGYGYQWTDADGRVCVSLMRPPNYFNGNGGMNPAHIHLALGDDAIETNQALFTQLYFSDDEWLTDLHPVELRMTPEPIADGERIRTDLVLP